jgi:hypothetical protein
MFGSARPFQSPDYPLLTERARSATYQALSLWPVQYGIPASQPCLSPEQSSTLEHQEEGGRHAPQCRETPIWR